MLERSSRLALLLALAGCGAGVYHADRRVPPGAVAFAIPDRGGYTLLVDTTEVSQREYAALLGTNPSWHRDCPDCPVESVSWYDAARFANARSEEQGLETCYALADCALRPPAEDESFRERRYRENRTGLECASAVSRGPGCTGYRLPTHLESATFRDRALLAMRPFRLDRYATYGRGGTGGASTTVVGSHLPDAQGLYDTFGNVEEWLDDPHPAPADARGRSAAEALWHGLGGGCLYTAYRRLGREVESVAAAASVRSCIGFRLVRTQPTAATEATEAR